MRLVEVVFWGSLAVALYAYGVYPLLIWLLSRWTRALSDSRPIDEDGAWPTVTLVIAANRDEHAIAGRLQNAMALDYPPGRLQILVGCVGEDDLTGLLARSFDKRQIEVVHYPTRGEACVVNACVRQARGQILVFSDARTLMRPDAVRRLAVHFHDPAIGSVCGKLVVNDPMSSRLLDRRFWRFESFLKRCETRLGAFPDVNRSIYAIRKELFVPLPGQTAAFSASIAVQIHRQGYRLLYDEWAVAMAEAPAVVEEPVGPRRLRAAFFNTLRLLWPLASPWCSAITLLCVFHKTLRRLCPGLLITAFVSNACLSDDAFYLHCLLFHELFYVAALTALYMTARGRWRWRLQGPLHVLRAQLEPSSGMGLNAGKSGDD